MGNLFDPEGGLVCGFKSHVGQCIQNFVMLMKSISARVCGIYKSSDMSRDPNMGIVHWHRSHCNSWIQIGRGQPSL